MINSTFSTDFKKKKKKCKKGKQFLVIAQQQVREIRVYWKICFLKISWYYIWAIWRSLDF